jgi:predicted nucleotidyltransferase
VALAATYGATRVSLCGSVARGDDIEGSDIDFYINEFLEPRSPDALERADKLVVAFRQVLAPFKVDVRGIPGWLLGPEHEASMKRDAVDLGTLTLRKP